jgi:DNA polymerase-3 subunit alpha
MLLGVLQVDKKEESLRLSCKWLADLTQVNDQMMVDCDLAYDKAKHQIARYAAMKSKNAQNSEAKNEAKPETDSANSKTSASNTTKHSPKVEIVNKVPPMNKPILLKIDADNIRLSVILKLKELFAEHRGTSPLEINFEGDGRSIASLKIDSTYGITPSNEFNNAIKLIPGITVSS